jgi:hypothetical protein
MTTTGTSRITKSKCAPKIWKKYNATQKRLWNLFYSEFIEEMNYPSELWGNSSRKQREIIAHNLACGAVHELTSEERTSCARNAATETLRKRDELRTTQVRCNCRLRKPVT